MTSHPITDELIELLMSIQSEVTSTQVQVQIHRAITLVTYIDEIVQNLNKIALDQFAEESAACDCGMEHDHTHGDHA